MKQNLDFAIIYNVLGVPLAAGLLFPFTGWLLSLTDRRFRDEPEFGVGDQQCPAPARRETASRLNGRGDALQSQDALTLRGRRAPARSAVCRLRARDGAQEQAFRALFDRSDLCAEFVQSVKDLTAPAINGPWRTAAPWHLILARLTRLRVALADIAEPHITCVERRWPQR